VYVEAYRVETRTKERTVYTMTKQDIIRKLTSRKMWVSIGAILAVWLAPGVTEGVSAGLTAIIAAAYALAEGLADSGTKK